MMLRRLTPILALLVLLSLVQTGIQDEDRSNGNIMKALADQMRKNPTQRMTVRDTT